MNPIEFKSADEILDEEINYKMFLSFEERNIMLNAMHKFREQKQPKSLMTRFKNLFKIKQIW